LSRSGCGNLVSLRYGKSGDPPAYVYFALEGNRVDRLTASNVSTRPREVALRAYIAGNYINNFAGVLSFTYTLGNIITI